MSFEELTGKHRSDVFWDRALLDGLRR
jgi:hypothetical protein